MQANPSPDQQQRNAHVLAVTSGKGGVGKTHIAVNLGIALAKQGYRVILLDMDLGLANADVLLNLRAEYTLSDVIHQRKRIEEVVVNAPGGLLIVPGASGDEELANLSDEQRQLLIEGLEGLEAQVDYLIIDTGAGIAENSMALAAAADDVLVVTTPEPTSMIDAYAAIKSLHRRAADRNVHLLVNMARNPKEARQVLLRLSSIAQGFIGSQLLHDGVIPYDPAVGDAVRHRHPLLLATPESPAAKAIRHVAQRIDSRPFEHHQRVEESSFIRRLFQYLKPT